jgi:hypothetical protein
MCECLSKSGITYYQLSKDESTPPGWLDYIIKETKKDTHYFVGNHAIAAKTDDDAKKIMADDYQLPGSECTLVTDSKTGLPIRRPLSHRLRLRRG